MNSNEIGRLVRRRGRIFLGFLLQEGSDSDSPGALTDDLFFSASNFTKGDLGTRSCHTRMRTSGGSFEKLPRAGSGGAISEGMSFGHCPSVSIAADLFSIPRFGV